MPLRRSQTPSWKSIEHWTQQNKTLEIPIESEAVNKAARPNSIRDRRVYYEVYESEADAKIISGKWVLKRRQARYVPKEDVKEEDVFGFSENATLSSNRSQERRLHSVHS